MNVSSAKLIIPAQIFAKFKIETQRDILLTTGFLAPTGPDASQALQPAAPFDPEEDLARFGDREWHEFLKGVGPKVRTTLEGIADIGPRWNVGKLLKKLGVNYSDLRGVQAGLTKRTHTIAKNDEANLYLSEIWDKEDINKCVTYMHPDTHAALRRALGKDKP
jgi:hypothetical protein